MGRGLQWIVALGVLIAVGPVAPARAADHPVSFPSGPFAGAYTPSSVEAGVGDTVTFSGAFASHPLVWNDGDFATRSTGTSDAYTFTRPGTFRFHCQIHATMTGVVHVPGNATAAPEFTWTVDGARASFVASGTDPDGTVARYEWDLDGDGTYETTGTATPVKTYSSNATYDVRLRYVDDAHETSPATAHAVTIAGVAPPPSGGGGGGTTPPPAGGGGGGTGGGAGTAPPASGGDGSATGPAPGGGGGQGAGDTGSPGLRIVSTALAFRRGRASVTLRLPDDGAVRLRVARAGTTLATGSATKLRAGSRRVTLTLTRAGTRALRSGKRLRATLTVTLRPRAGGAATTKRATVTLRR